MGRIVWNAIGERVFEAGVDQGVLYLDGADGVPWNGLISVSESPSGGDVTPYYVDGVKYLNGVSAEEYEATIDAYTYPDEFGLCDGTVPVKFGLYATQQPKVSFGLSYRTKIGNDVDGTEHGYKIHLVYGATASPSNRSNHTMSDSVEPFNFSWKIVTQPPNVPGYKPTAHFVIDSRETPSDLLDRISEILYGSDTTAPRMPSVAELLYIFDEYQASIFDAGFLTEQYFATFDAGFALAASAADPSYVNKMISVPVVPNISYFIDGALVTSGSTFGPTSDSMVIAVPADGYGYELDDSALLGSSIDGGTP